MGAEHGGNSPLNLFMPLSGMTYSESGDLLCILWILRGCMV